MENEETETGEGGCSRKRGGTKKRREARRSGKAEGPALPPGASMRAADEAAENGGAAPAAAGIRRRAGRENINKNFRKIQIKRKREHTRNGY